MMEIYLEQWRSSSLEIKTILRQQQTELSPGYWAVLLLLTDVPLEAISVSYTHLDVYKRQESRNAETPSNNAVQN